MSPYGQRRVGYGDDGKHGRARAKRMANEVEQAATTVLTMTGDEFSKDASGAMDRIREGGHINLTDTHGKLRSQIVIPKPIACDDPDCVEVRERARKLDLVQAPLRKENNALRKNFERERARAERFEAVLRKVLELATWDEEEHDDEEPDEDDMSEALTTIHRVAWEALRAAKLPPTSSDARSEEKTK